LGKLGEETKKGKAKEGEKGKEAPKNS